MSTETVSKVYDIPIRGLLKVAAVITLDRFNVVLATIIGLLTIVHLLIRIRKESKDK